MNYICKYILDCFRNIYKVPSEVEIGYGSEDKKINIKKGNISFFDTSAVYPYGSEVWKEWRNENIPFLFDKSDKDAVLEFRDDHCYINYDIIASSFFFLSGWQEYLFLNGNSAAKFSYEDSIQKKLGIAYLPVVNYYFDILRKAIKSVYGIDLEISFWGSKKFGLCLTHDIDKCTTGWLEGGFNEFKKGRLFTFFQLIYKRIFSDDVWFNFKDILELEKRFSAVSSYYFMAEKGRFKGNGDYDIENKKFKKVLSDIKDSGSEIGIHGSPGTHLNLKKFSREIKKLPYPVIGGRFHFLNFDIKNSFDIVEKAGLKYDSTLGFAGQPGFRNGITFPFRPYNFKEKRSYEVVEIPLIVMDATFIYHTKSSLDEALERIEQLIEEVKKWNGCLTILWHNNYFSSCKYSGWKELYETVLRRSLKNNALLVNGEQVYGRWT